MNGDDPFSKCAVNRFGNVTVRYFGEANGLPRGVLKAATLRVSLSDGLSRLFQQLAIKLSDMEVGFQFRCSRFGSIQSLRLHSPFSNMTTPSDPNRPLLVLVLIESQL
jgi:hypothetical protein